MSATSTVGIATPTGERAGRFRIERTVVSSRPAFRWGRVTLVWRPRFIVVGILLVLFLLITTFAGIMLGNLRLSIGETWATLQGEGNPLFRKVIMESRIPRVLMAALAGFALAVGGAITQAVARNALASPDILGIDTGASAIAFTMIIGVSKLGNSDGLILVGNMLEWVGRPAAAMIGAYLTAILIWFLAWKKGVQTFRLVLMGMGVSMLLGAYMQVLVLRADVWDLQEVMRWTTGSMAHATWNGLLPITVGIVILLPAMGWMGARLRVASLGKDSALGLGEKWNHTQAALWLSAITMSALVVSAVGPIGFVSFVCPQIAMRLTRTPIQPIFISGLTGAVLVSSADVFARVISPYAFPVGVVTSGLGAPVLLYLLIKTRRKMTV